MKDLLVEPHLLERFNPATALRLNVHRIALCYRLSMLLRTKRQEIYNEHQFYEY
jgi:hypothetical protein